MRRLLIASALATLPFPALAGTGLSAEIGETGITATLARLSALPAPTDEERFAIGGLEFLAALERVYQLRWQVGMPRGFDMMFGMAGQLGNNPNPRDLDPAEITTILDDTLSGMERARAALENIPEDSAFGFELDFADLWLDADGDGKRGLAESLIDIAGPALFGGWRWRQRQQAQGPLPVIRFDTADAPWLAAYTHLISGTTQMIRAYDPAPAIARVGEANAILRDQATEADPYGYANFIDMFAIVDGTLRHEPDAARTLAARDHYLSMVSENRRFWALVAQETDNDREWIPNDAQVSATGLSFPKGIGATWLAVLEDGEGLLTGRLAAPYPKDIFFGRATSDAPGLDISKLFTEPRPVDIVGWFQGWAALPYLSDAPQVTALNMRQFERLVSGEAPLFMVFLN